MTQPPSWLHACVLCAVTQGPTTRQPHRQCTGCQCRHVLANMPWFLKGGVKCSPARGQKDRHDFRGVFFGINGMLGSLFGGGPLRMSQFNVMLFSSRISSYSLNRGPHIVTVQQAPQMTYPVQQASLTRSATIARFRLRVHSLSSPSRLTWMPHCSLASPLVPCGLFPTMEPQGPFKLGVRIMSPLAQSPLSFSSYSE